MAVKEQFICSRVAGDRGGGGRADKQHILEIKPTLMFFYITSLFIEERPMKTIQPLFGGMAQFLLSNHSGRDEGLEFQG